MKDAHKAVEQLLRELAGMRQRIETLETRCKQAEQALERSIRQLDSRERLITRILESIPSSVVVIDRSLRIVWVNRNFLEKTRRKVQDTLGRKAAQVFPRMLLERTQLRQRLGDTFRTGQTVEGGKVAYRAPGLPTRIYYYRLVPLVAGALVENVMLLMDDITEREQLVEDVRRAEAHLASLVECAKDVVVSIGTQGHILTWNRAAERVSGLRAGEVQGRLLLSLCSPEQHTVMAETLQRVARGEGVQNAEVNLLTPDGQEVPIAWSCSPMRDDVGGAAGVVLVARDLTERRRPQAQLVQSAKMASLGVMGAAIAHELRNPLAVISAAAQLLLGRPDARQLRDECARTIYAATQRASQIIGNLLESARPASEQMREIDLHAVLEETLALLSHQMSLQKVTLRKEFQAELPWVYGNPVLLQQVFTNLIVNAQNAMPEGGMLTVATPATKAEDALSRGVSTARLSSPKSELDKVSARAVEIRFSDTGCGIPPENLPRIFDPFFTTMPAPKGIGLGLSISYGIVQHHQGTMEVESQVGKGTTFTIRLPTCGEWNAAHGR